MKKYLIFSIILLTSLFIIDNVSAMDTSTYESKLNIEFINTINMSNDEVTNIMTEKGFITTQITEYISCRNYNGDNYNKKFIYLGKYAYNTYYQKNGAEIYLYNTDDLYNNYIEFSDSIVDSSRSEYLLKLSFKNSNFEYKKNQEGSFNTSSTSKVSYNNTFYVTSPISNVSYIDTPNNQIILYESDLDIIYNNTFIINTKSSNKYYKLPKKLYINDVEIKEYDNISNPAPKLNYKTGFISNENNSLLGKISVDFNETDENIVKFGYAEFKLQYGSNDFTEENIPVFSHYKIYGRNNDEGTWELFNENTIKFPIGTDENENIIYADHNLIIENTTFDYSPGTLADSSITFKVLFDDLKDLDLSTTDPLYKNWKIEFYIDNTSNAWIYTYDTLKKSNWNDTEKFLDDYVYYYFPSEYKYAYIGTEKGQNDGKIYFPNSFANSNLVKLQFQYFNISMNFYEKPLEIQTYAKDEYYSYVDFSYNSNTRILSVNRLKGSNSYKSYYSKNGATFSSYIKTLLGTINSTLPIKLSVFDMIEENEDSYFYAPIGSKVIFSNDEDLINVMTENGIITIDPNDTYNDYENSFDNNNNNNSTNNYNNILDYLKNIFNNNSNIFDTSKNVFDMFINSKLGTYLRIVLYGTIIIFLINVMRK